MGQITPFILVILIAALLFLIVRFVQPELIYAIRGVLRRVRSNKLFLDSDGGRVDGREFKQLLIDDLRGEVATYDRAYVFQRLLKLQELLRTIQYCEEVGDRAVPSAQVYLGELGDLLRATIELSDLEYRTEHVIRAAGIVKWLTEMRQGHPVQIEDDQVTVQALRRNPASVAQVAEIIIACAFVVLHGSKDAQAAGGRPQAAPSGIVPGGQV